MRTAVSRIEFHLLAKPPGLQSSLLPSQLPRGLEDISPTPAQPESCEVSDRTLTNSAALRLPEASSRFKICRSLAGQCVLAKLSGVHRA